jgi:hypothetical protein
MSKYKCDHCEDGNINVAEYYSQTLACPACHRWWEAGMYRQYVLPDTAERMRDRSCGFKDE